METRDKESQELEPIDLDVFTAKSRLVAALVVLINLLIGGALITAHDEKETEEKIKKLKSEIEVLENSKLPLKNDYKNTLGVPLKIEQLKKIQP